MSPKSRGPRGHGGGEGDDPGGGRGRRHGGRAGNVAEGEAQTGVTFTARDGAGGRGKLRLQSNDLTDAGGDYHQLPDFPEYRYLLFVDKFDNPDDVRGRLAGLPQWRFLYRSVVE